jgi:mono/diheme cytochrome c family protein
LASYQAAADIARGKALFAGTCGAYCHRPSNAAAGPATDAPNLFDCDWRHGGSDAEIFHSITTGVSGTRMVAFGGALPDAEIWRIIAYLRSASQCPKPATGNTP